MNAEGPGRYKRRSEGEKDTQTFTRSRYVLQVKNDVPVVAAVVVVAAAA